MKARDAKSFKSVFAVLVFSAVFAANLNPVRGASAAPTGAWKSVGPAPPAIAAAIAADAASHTIYIGSEGGGVLKSTDGGATFLPLSGLPNPSVMSMVIDPRNPNVVYAGGFKTIDGGATWIDLEGHGGGFAMAIDPNNPDTIYSAGFGVEKTNDGGASWEDVSEGLGGAAIFSIAINPFNPNVLFAGSTGDGAFKSIDGGASWSPVDIDSTAYGLLVDPDDGNIVYAGSNGNGVYKSTNGGDTFVRVGSPKIGVVFSIAKSHHKLYAGTAGGGVSVSEDGGVTWKSTGVSQSQGLMLSVDSGGAVYLATSFDGAFVLPATNDRDRNRSGQWRRLAWDQLKSCACQQGHGLAVDPSDHNHVFFTTNDGGLLVTENGGRSWKDGGVFGFTARASRSVAFDPQQPRRVYASSTTGGLYKSEDHGKHWKRRRFGASTNYTTGISVDPVDHSVYVATLTNLGVRTNGIWKSTDFGETFTRIDRAPNAPAGEFLDLSGRGITVDPHRHRTIYFADRNTGIWRSRNAGASWVNVEPQGVFSVTVDPTDSNVVYAGATSEVGVLKSTDGGATFLPKSIGLLESQTSRTGAVQVNPKHPNVLYVGTEDNGVFQSTDGAETWAPFNMNLDDLGVFGLAMDPKFPGVLYASTNSSVHKFSMNVH